MFQIAGGILLAFVILYFWSFIASSTILLALVFGAGLIVLLILCALIIGATNIIANINGFVTNVAKAGGLKRWLGDFYVRACPAFTDQGVIEKEARLLVRKEEAKIIVEANKKHKRQLCSDDLTRYISQIEKNERYRAVNFTIKDYTSPFHPMGGEVAATAELKSRKIPENEQPLATFSFQITKQGGVEYKVSGRSVVGRVYLANARAKSMFEAVIQTQLDIISKKEKQEKKQTAILKRVEGLRSEKSA